MYKELNHFTALRCVEAAARHQSYSAAATELHVTQAAVSQQIRLLERQLGCKLFFRQGRQMRLTEQGQRLALSLSKGFDELVQGLRSIQCEPLNGPLTVTTTQSFATMVLMPNMWKFSLQYPDIVVRVLVSTTLEDVQHGKIDVAIRYGFSEFPSLEQHILFEDKTVPLCSPKLAADIDFSTLESLKQCWLVNYTHSNYWQTWFAEAGLTLDNSYTKWMEVSNLDIALSAVIAGNGICLAPAAQARHYLEQGLLIQPYPISSLPKVRYTLMYDANSPRSKRIRVFKDWLLEIMAGKCKTDFDSLKHSE
ncbi:LysR substrate-binding domain-containing protein [Pseudoalteromonas fenneropenaei]|uniref:LysR substrate-binding domain-containing protein n=1 Tax=Pseudoalteromonas fenneropenaei TaxID=1737459 RepID=A0ABV7CIY2_9GAMM